MHSDILRSRYHKTVRNAGFTLVELLIAVAILIILLTLSVAAFSTTSSADRIRSSARQVQSAVAGARDRAIKAGKATGGDARRGIRLIQDANNPGLVTSFIYVGSEANWRDGQVVVGRAADASGHATTTSVRTVRAWPKIESDGVTITLPAWKQLYDQGLLVDGARIRIPADTGNWYTVSTASLASWNGNGPQILTLNADFLGSGYIPPPIAPTSGLDTKWGTAIPPLADDDQNGTADNFSEFASPGSDDDNDINANTAIAKNVGQTYELELLPTVLPGAEPLRLSSRVAIDLYDKDPLGLPLAKTPPAWFNQISLSRGTALPTADYDAIGRYNGWGSWVIEGPDPSNSANDIYRQYSNRMDIMFSPSGNVVGPLSATGMIHFRLADMEDINNIRNPADPAATMMLYSTLFTQTGFVATFPVDTTDVDNNQIADNPLYFARIGSTVGR